MSDAELIQKSDLIVVGTWVGQSTITLEGTPKVQALGSIAISEVLKGDTKLSVALVIVPPPSAPIASDSIVRRPGERGLWLLRKSGETGLYLADHPQRFLAAGKADAQINTLRKLLARP